MPTSSDPKHYFDVISPAADTAVAFARLLRTELIGEPAYYAEAGGLGFGYTDQGGALAIVVDWNGARCLQVVAPLVGDGPRTVSPFDDGGPWIKELQDSLRDLQGLVAARKTSATDGPRH